MATISLPDTLPNLDEVAEPIRQFYEPGEDGVFQRVNIDPLKNAMKNAKAERAALAEEVKAARRALDAVKGVDPQKYQTLLEREQQLMEFDQTKGLEIDKIKGEITRVYDGKLAAEAAEKAKYRQAAENIARDNLITSALSKAGVNELGMRYLAGQLQSEISFEWHGDKVVAKLLDANGAQRLNPETFDPLTIDDLLSQHRKDAPVFFNSQFNGQGGSGTSENRGSGDPPPSKPPGQWTFQEIKAYNLKHGSETAYEQLLKAKK